MADQGAEGLLSPYLRSKRMEAAAPYLKGRIIDYGCGSGALAALIPADHYLGVETDNISLQQARSRFTSHRFVSELPSASPKFDTIVSLAVIEHVQNHSQFLQTLAKYLKDIPSSRLIITTPHPSVGWVHDLGAMIGLFSKHANDEHGDLLDRAKLEIAGKQAGLKLISYSRFLLGANQIAIYTKNG